MPMPRHIPVTPSEIRTVGKGVYRVRFAVPAAAARFRAGQFLHLTLDEFDPSAGFWPESRVFSIASKPRSDHIDIVYSVKGSYTSRMERELAVGVPCWIKMPYGDFIVDRRIPDGRTAVLVAGGTGLAPFIPYLTDGTKRNERPVILYYGVRDASLLAFREELQDAEVSMENLDIRIFIEIGNADIEYRRGRLDHRIVLKETREARPVYFLSGPPVMIEAFKNGLIGEGVDEDDVVIDEWE